VSAQAPAAAAGLPPHTFLERLLDRIERLGNKMPHPVILFLYLCGAVIVVSQILYWTGWKATYEVVAPPPAAAEQTYYGGSVEPTYVGPTEPEPASSYKVETQTAKVKGLLTGSGVRYLFTSFVSNFRNFAAVAIILVVMLGVGLAESVGLIAALIRKLVAASSRSTLTFIIVLLGVLSSIASDAGYLVLIPLGAAAFKSVGRNPLAGIAGSGAHAHHIDLAANLFFGIGSTIFITIVMTIITAKLVENRLGAWDPADMGEGPQEADDAPAITHEAESRGLRYAMWATLAVLAAIALLTFIPGAPLRNPVTGKIIGDSPFMDSLIVIITLVFFAAGAAFGKGAGTLENKEAAIESITKSWAGLVSLLLLFLFIAQFIAYFNFSNIAEVAAVKLGDVLERINIGPVWLLIGVILITAIVNIIIPQAIGKWALLAPIFIPLFIRLNVAPQTVLAAYRVGDSPGNVLTPLMAYFPLIVIFTQRYKKDAGIGTVIALMLPYVVILYIAWTLFFVIWYLTGIPLGPGSPVHL
jgi:aminobenzoyl-glutamate transport protein